MVVWGLSGRFKIASLQDAGVRSYSLPQTAEPRGCTPSAPCLGLSRFSLSEAVEEFPGSLYILTVVWGMSGRPEIASLRDAGVRSYSLPPDCRAEGLHSCLGLLRFSLFEVVKVMLGCCYISIRWVGGRIVDFDSCPFGIQAKAPD